MADTVAGNGKTKRKQKLMTRGSSMEHMRNKNESLVIKAMEEILPEMSSLCECCMCTEDIFAISLNALPSTYQHSMSIDLHGKPNYKKAYKAVKKAAKIVMEKPKHS